MFFVEDVQEIFVSQSEVNSEIFCGGMEGLFDHRRCQVSF